MKDFLLIAWDYLVKVFVSSFTHLIIIFGPLILLAVLMNLVAGTNEKLCVKTLGQKIYLFFFGWLGTIIHELGHALFAVIFAHKIDEMKLFSPDPKTHTLGYVKHSFDKRNIYQQIGNFFIGIGPVLMCCFALWLISWLLFKIKLNDISTLTISPELVKSFSALKLAGISIWEGFKTYYTAVIHGENSTWWKIVILVYCIFSIGSSITLSKSDIVTAKDGLLFVIVLIVIFNLFTVWKSDFAMSYVVKLSSLLSGFYFIIILSLVLNLIFMLILGVIFKIKEMF